MAQNGRHSQQRQRIEMAGPSASPEEAAATIAAIEQFLRDTAGASGATPARINPWRRAAMYEGAGLIAESPAPWLEPWGDAEPWGSR